MTAALVALGSNLGARRATLEAAFDALAALPRTTLSARSRLHETAPVGCPPGSQPFLNAVALLDTELAPHELLAQLHAIEARHGRRREGANAPRTLDLDLVLHGASVIHDSELQLPHPRAHQRAFVLEPAAEVAPGLRHPELGATLAELRDALRGEAAGPAGGD